MLPRSRPGTATSNRSPRHQATILHRRSRDSTKLDEAAVYDSLVVGGPKQR